jgi:hypothetical protein
MIGLQWCVMQRPPGAGQRCILRAACESALPGGGCPARSAIGALVMPLPRHYVREMARKVIGRPFPSDKPIR